VVQGTVEENSRRRRPWRTTSGGTDGKSGDFARGREWSRGELGGVGQGMSCSRGGPVGTEAG
jgi:hypothetical protein